MGADPNSRLLKLTTVVSSARDFSLSHERGLRYDEPPRLKTDPEGLVRYEFLSSLFVAVLLTILSLSALLCAQTTTKETAKVSTGSISGRVTIKDKGVPGAAIGLRMGDNSTPFEGYTRITRTRTASIASQISPPEVIPFSCRRLLLFLKLGITANKRRCWSETVRTLKESTSRLCVVALSLAASLMPTGDRLSSNKLTFMSLQCLSSEYNARSTRPAQLKRMIAVSIACLACLQVVTKSRLAEAMMG